MLAWPSLFPVAMKGKDGILRYQNARIAEVAVGLAILTLRDEGAITMEIVTRSALREAGSRMRHGKAAFAVFDARASRTHVVVTRTVSEGNPLGLGGQLLALCKSPMLVSDLVFRWIDANYEAPADHVVWALTKLAFDQGFYRSASREGTGLISRHLKAKQVLEPIDERVASIKSNAVALASRWQAFAEEESVLHKQVLIDVARGISRRVKVESDDEE